MKDHTEELGATTLTRARLCASTSIVLIPLFLQLMMALKATINCKNSQAYTFLGWQNISRKKYIYILIRLTRPKSGNAFDGKRRKNGDGLTNKKRTERLLVLVFNMSDIQLAHRKHRFVVQLLSKRTNQIRGFSI